MNGRDDCPVTIGNTARTAVRVKYRVHADHVVMQSEDS